MSGYDVELSLVIPCHNEEGNLRALIDAVGIAMAPLDISYEVIISDDCSTDNSWVILKEIAQADFHIRIQRFKFNCGESVASWAGIQVAHGRYIVTLDADLQNDLSDLPLFLEAYCIILKWTDILSLVPLFSKKSCVKKGLQRH